MSVVMRRGWEDGASTAQSSPGPTRTREDRGVRSRTQEIKLNSLSMVPDLSGGSGLNVWLNHFPGGRIARGVVSFH
jgi:hypothetical protein